MTDAPDALDRIIQAVFPAYLTNTGHGHVWPRPNGKRSRCDGRARCAECAHDADKLKAARDYVANVVAQKEARS